MAISVILTSGESVRAEDDCGDLLEYRTGARMAAATREHRDASRVAAKVDGGAGVILIDEQWRLVDPASAGAGDAVRVYVSE